ncbi:snrpb [Symbiodinium pilosum]|uniref:Sm protein B n=1 Tax=Symbiodinium pilosum TaxID=2952 RepID=A0A812WBA7_SYMPI|nr:snrpb [Symbiodinium pilosum]
MGKVRAVRRKLAQFFNWRVSVTLTDGRVLVGVLMAVDRHVNIVLCNTEEYRKYKVKGKPEGKELKRMLGFIVVRGTGILYIQPEELGKEDLVETDKPRKKAAPAATPAAKPAPAAKAAAAPALNAAALLAGMRPPLMNPLLAAGLRPGGLPGMPGMPALPGMPNMGLPNMGGMPGAGRGMPSMPGMPAMPRPM